MRSLWADSDPKARFFTRGGFHTVGVRGTTWLTEDHCDGTLVHVVEGSVTVEDFVQQRSVVVNQGGTHFVEAPRSECDGEGAAGTSRTSRGPLPLTGFDPLAGVALGSLLLVSGATVVTWAKRLRAGDIPA